MKRWISIYKKKCRAGHILLHLGRSTPSPPLPSKSRYLFGGYLGSTVSKMSTTKNTLRSRYRYESISVMLFIGTYFFRTSDNVDSFLTPLFIKFIFSIFFFFDYLKQICERFNNTPLRPNRHQYNNIILPWPDLTVYCTLKPIWNKHLYSPRTQIEKELKPVPAYTCSRSEILWRPAFYTYTKIYFDSIWNLCNFWGWPWENPIALDLFREIIWLSKTFKSKNFNFQNIKAVLY